MRRAENLSANEIPRASNPVGLRISKVTVTLHSNYVRTTHVSPAMASCTKLNPRRGFEYVTRKISYGAAQIKLGLKKDLHLGNLDAERDWGYAVDYVKAMWSMLQQDKPDDYVIATGETHTIREFCDTAFSRLGLNYQDHVVFDRQFYRPVEAVPLVGDASHARTALDWKPTITFTGLVEMMVDEDIASLTRK